MADLFAYISGTGWLLVVSWLLILLFAIFSRFVNIKDVITYMTVNKPSLSENISLLIAIVLVLGGLIIMPYIVVAGVNFLSNQLILARGLYISSEVKALISVIVLVLLMSASIVAISEYLHQQFSRKRAQQDHILRQKNPDLFNAIANHNATEPN